MTTCRQPELKYNPLLPHLIVFILITIKFSESCQSSASCSLNICLLLCMIAPPLPERVSRAKTNIINLETLKMNLWPRVELDGRARWGTRSWNLKNKKSSKCLAESYFPHKRNCFTYSLDGSNEEYSNIHIKHNKYKQMDLPQFLRWVLNEFISPCSQQLACSVVVSLAGWMCVHDVSFRMYIGTKKSCCIFQRFNNCAV